MCARTALKKKTKIKKKKKEKKLKTSYRTIQMYNRTNEMYSPDIYST